MYLKKKHRDSHRPKCRRITLIIAIIAYFALIYAAGGEDMTVLSALASGIKELANAVITAVRQVNENMEAYAGEGAKFILYAVTAVLVVAIFFIIKWGMFGDFVYGILSAFMPNLPEKSVHKQIKSFKGKYTTDSGLIDEIKYYNPDYDAYFFESIYEKAGLYDIYVLKRNAEKDAYGRKRRSQSRDENSVALFTKTPMCVIERSSYVSAVEIEPEFIELLGSRIKNPALRSEVLTFSLAHECIHVKYHDGMNMRWRLVLSMIAWLGGFPLTTLLFFKSASFGSIILSVLSGALLFFWIAFVSVILSVTYWCQCAEFRADRLAARVSEADTDLVFEAYARCGYGSPDEEHTRESRLKEYGRLLKSVFSSKYVPESLAHPSSALRKKELKLRKNWGLYDYVRYGFLMRISLFTGKGGRL